MLVNVKDPSANLTHLSLTAMLGGESFTVFSTNLQPVASQNVQVQFKFPDNGYWKLAINALSASGNASLTVLPSNGSGIYVGTLTQSPILLTYKVVGTQVTTLQFGKFTTDATVYWQIKPRGTPPDAQGAGTWNTAIASITMGAFQSTPAIPNFATGQTLYAYSTVRDFGNSATVQWNIDR